MAPLLARHLAASDGLITTSRALSLGVTSRQLDGLVTRGELERVHRGVYRSTAVPVTQRHRLLAGLLVAGDAAVISHRSSTLCPADVERVDRMWVTTKERTAIDSCSLLPPTLVMRFVEHWLADRRVRLDDLNHTIDRLWPLPGAVALSEQVQARSLARVVADSVAEHRLGELLLRSGLAAEHHVMVTTATGYTYELDWAYPDVVQQVAPRSARRETHLHGA